MFDLVPVETITKQELIYTRFYHIKFDSVDCLFIQPGPFEIIQVRVQKFLGRIGGFAHLLVSEVDLVQVTGTGGLAWDPVDRIKFNLPFKQDKPDIWLGTSLLVVLSVHWRLFAIFKHSVFLKIATFNLIVHMCSFFFLLKTHQFAQVLGLHAHVNYSSPKSFFNAAFQL